MLRLLIERSSVFVRVRSDGLAIQKLPFLFLYHSPILPCSGFHDTHAEVKIHEEEFSVVYQLKRTYIGIDVLGQ